MEKNKPVHLLLSYDHCPVAQHPQLQLTQQQLEAEMTRKTVGRVGTGTVSIPEQKNPKTPGRDTCQCATWVKGPSLETGSSSLI